MGFPPKDRLFGLKNTISEENLREILLVKLYLKVYGRGLPSEIFRTLILTVFTLRKSKYILISIRRSKLVKKVSVTSHTQCFHQLF